MFSFHHVSLSVKNIDESVHFYSLLGFKKVYYWEANDKQLQIVHLKLGEAFIEMFCYASYNDPPESSKDLSTDLPRIGIKHFGIKVKSINHTKNQLIKNGMLDNAEVTRGRTGIDYFFMRDPNGIFVEIVQDDRDL